MLHGQEFCKPATEWHECFYGSAYLRNTSMDYGAQIPVCQDHHRQIHAKNHGIDDRLKVRFQQQIMDNYNMTIEDFIKIFGRSYI